MLRTQMGLPPLYTCSKCGLEVNLKSQQTLQMIKGWAKPNKKTIVKIEDEFPSYVHEYCLISVGITMNSLF